jgi:rod shape-determining protein MreC
MLGAKVIAKDYNSWTNTITIDRGSSDGVNKYMPVIVPQGVVGFVSSVSRYTSQVQLLVDPRTAIGGIVQRPESRVASILKGDGNNSDFLVFGNIPKEADVIKGDTIVTSGYGGVYPKGLLIGTVSQVSADGSGVSLAALVKPAVDFTKVEEVFVITNSVQKVNPGDINNQIPIKEPAMNPNEQQASDGDTPVVPAKGE